MHCRLLTQKHAIKYYNNTVPRWVTKNKIACGLIVVLSGAPLSNLGLGSHWLVMLVHDVIPRSGGVLQKNLYGDAQSRGILTISRLYLEKRDFVTHLNTIFLQKAPNLGQIGCFFS